MVKYRKDVSNLKYPFQISLFRESKMDHPVHAINTIRDLSAQVDTLFIVPQERPGSYIIEPRLEISKDSFDQCGKFRTGEKEERKREKDIIIFPLGEVRKKKKKRRRA